MVSCTGLTTRWIMRFGLMAVMMIAFALYFGRDGFFRYPEDNKIWETYQKYKDKPEQWENVADDNGWSIDPPEKRHTQTSLMTQRGIAVACGVLALVTVVWIGLSARKKLTADESGLACGAVRLAYDAITKIDKSLWDNKGIAVVHYQRDGRRGTITIDDYKYKGGQAVLDIVEQHTGGESGESATPPDDQPAESDTPS